MSTEAMEALCAEVVGALGDVEVDTLVLKGPAVARWLYTDGAARAYHDIDLLVDPADLDIAQALLLELGFVPPAPAYTDDVPGHAQAWHRYGDGAWLDLHYTLTGVSAPPAHLWAALWPGRQHLEVGGASVAVLGEPARALHLALHLAQDHLGQGKKLEDLRRALAQLPPRVWTEAAELARELDACAAMGAGLRQVPEGAALAERLGLPEVDRMDLLVRSSGAPTGTDAFEWLARRPGTMGKVRYVAAKAFPPPWFLRAWTPVATRYGPLGLAAGYVQRLAWLARVTPPAARSWHKARRELQRRAGRRAGG